MAKRKILILGAAGRDFHNFNVLYRDNEDFDVIAFTATQIPGIAGRKYPSSMSGKLYPQGIPILEEKDLDTIIKNKKIDECVLSYSDLSYDYVMHLASRVAAAGATFTILGAAQTMLKSKKPVIAVCAVRTGCGKSQTTRRIVEIFKENGKKAVTVRHPMPYGVLERQRVQRFEKLQDLEKYDCTIEEMEEYEPHIVMGSIIYAGVDYAAILEKAEKEADVIIWDGGNNDTPFYVPDLHVVLTDPLRPGHEIGYYPGEVNLRMADVVIINKIDTAKQEDIMTVLKNIQTYNPKAEIIHTESKVRVLQPEVIKNKRVLIIEDGPTVTHGEMKIGAGTVAAERTGVSEIVDPRPYVVGSIAEAYDHYPEIGKVLPAMGYGKEQMRDLEKTIEATICDAVVIGTPIDLTRFIKINKPSTRVRYELGDEGKAALVDEMKKKKLI
jgi:predicted GTPase